MRLIHQRLTNLILIAVLLIGTGCNATLTDGANLDANLSADSDDLERDMTTEMSGEPVDLDVTTVASDASQSDASVMSRDGTIALSDALISVDMAPMDVALIDTAFDDASVIQADYRLTFRVRMPSGYQGGVTVANSYDGWNVTGRVQLTDPDRDGVFVGSMQVPPGLTFEYCYLR